MLVRGSIGTPVTRCTQVSSRTTCAARANAAAVAASSPTSISRHRLPGAVSHSSGAAGRHRVGGPRHRRQRLICRSSTVPPRPWPGDALGDHESDRLADIAGLVGRHRVVGGRDRREAAGSRLHIGRRRERGIVRDRPEPVGDIVGPGQHRERTGRGECCCPVDRDDPRMRMRRAHEHRVRHPAQCDVVGKAASPVSSRKSSLRRTGCPIPVLLTVARIRFSCRARR